MNAAKRPKSNDPPALHRHFNPQRDTSDRPAVLCWLRDGAGLREHAKSWGDHAAAAVALRLEAADRQAEAVMVGDTAATDASRPIVMLDGAGRKYQHCCGALWETIRQRGR